MGALLVLGALQPALRRTLHRALRRAYEPTPNPTPSLTTNPPPSLTTRLTPSLTTNPPPSLTTRLTPSLTTRPTTSLPTKVESLPLAVSSRLSAGCAAKRGGRPLYCNLSRVTTPLHSTIEEFAADGCTHVECYCPRCRVIRRGRLVGFHDASGPSRCCNSQRTSLIGGGQGPSRSPPCNRTVRRCASGYSTPRQRPIRSDFAALAASASAGSGRSSGFAQPCRHHPGGEVGAGDGNGADNGRQARPVR